MSAHAGCDIPLRPTPSGRDSVTDLAVRGSGRPPTIQVSDVPAPPPQVEARPVAIPHGTSGYSAGCRCDVCVGAKAAYEAGRRKKIKARRAQIGADPVLVRAWAATMGIACPEKGPVPMSVLEQFATARTAWAANLERKALGMAFDVKS